MPPAPPQPPRSRPGGNAIAMPEPSRSPAAWSRDSTVEPVSCEVLIQQGQVRSGDHPGGHRVLNQPGPTIDRQPTGAAVQAPHSSTVEFVADVVELAVEARLFP